MLNIKYSSTRTMAEVKMTGVFVNTVVCIYLMIFCCSTSQTQACHNVYRMQSMLNKEILKLLTNMTETPFMDCPQEEPNFQSPFVNYTLMVTEVKLRAILVYTKRIFNNDLSKVTAEKDAAGIKSKIETLQSMLSWMLDLWTNCLFKEMTTAASKIHSQPKKDIKIKIYFQRMTTYLKSEDYSTCAWGAVRYEVRKIMRFVTKSVDILIKQHQ